MQGFHKILRLEARIGPFKFLRYSGLRRRGMAVWDFKGKAGNSQVDEKAQTRDKPTL